MRHAAAALLISLASASLVAQQSTPRLTFEVAAIKRNVSGNIEGRLAMQPGGHFRAINFDVRNLIAFAYRTKPRNLLPSQIIGAPGWLTTERYDIVANIGAELVARGPSDPFQTPRLVQSLLEDRFKLEAHREKREMAVYDLVLARTDGSLGPHIRRAGVVDCIRERDKCALRSLDGHVAAGAVTMETLCGLLSPRVERLVVDRTGLEGQFDVDIDWSPDQSTSDKPSIFTAVQEQLGLKLDAAREPVDVVVIDHIERPTED